VRNLLAFVRRSSSERTIADVNDIVKSTISLRSYEFGSANIRLFESYAERLPSVVVNPEEIQQVILNLILNAEQAMRSAHRGGTLTVTTRCDDAMVTIEIQDDGPGVPAALAGRVFEPFFSTKEVGEGTGLGLSIAMGIAEAHAGALTLVPTEQGACFRLALPGVDVNDRLPAASLVSVHRA
jgi:signal transduction histidine kinase